MVWWVSYGLERGRLRSVWFGLEGDVEIGCCHGMAGGSMWVQDQPNGEWFKNCGGWVVGFNVVLAIEEVWVWWCGFWYIESGGFCSIDLVVANV